ncbi:FAD-binding oxidoreductase [Rhodoferax sediminis]|uniref:Delta(24)-sterol reductase n=1 Tax=Rhodoferax sediminis TaxID=2509614 RepID=A0A515DA64_9BURK|nr:FAD-binding oxidoreductase [Rhodoferax sediminis]QDL37307.1 FAD-binding oxidoreductase [Rhodoferax sediminis]
MDTARPEILAHAERAAQAAAQMRARASEPEPIALRKSTSNLFRDRRENGRHRLDLGDMRHVIGADAQAGWVDVEGMITYEDLVAWTLPRGCMPAVVPQLKTITVGGACAGVGIEATSFRHGLVHDTLQEIEVLLPQGDIVVCTPGNEHSDLFFGFPNSYGTLGYALRLRIGTLDVQPLVRVEHRACADGEAFFEALAAQCRGDADFVDAVVFGEHEHVLSVGRFTREAPWRSDYSFEHIYYQSLRSRQQDYLSTQDYLWRWDTDWFWCSKNFGAQHPLVRRLLGRERLNSRTYTRWMRLNARWQLTQRLARWRGRYRESVIQDVDIPLERAAEFLAFLQREIGILPIWVCPVRGEVTGRQFPLYRLAAAPLYINFGFWDVIESPLSFEPGHFNRLVEGEVMRLGGIKSLYSESFFTPGEFAQAYDLVEYERLKARYDPRGRAPHLYDKCVLRA